MFTRGLLTRFRGDLIQQSPSTPVTDPTDWYLSQATQWSHGRRDLDPGPYVAQDPDESARDAEWNANLHRRGLGDPDDYNYVYKIIKDHGLDVVLHLPDLPPGEEFLWTETSLFWTDPDQKYNLMKINTVPGPLWLNFVASNYPRAFPGFEFHISLCYQWELWEWFTQDWDKDKIRTWIQKYREVQRRYNGRKARIMGKITGGHGLELDSRCRVEGLQPPHIVFDGNGGDEDVRYIHRLPGHRPFSKRGAKSEQDLHISLLIDPMD